MGWLYLMLAGAAMALSPPLSVIVNSSLLRSYRGFKVRSARRRAELG